MFYSFHNPGVFFNRFATADPNAALLLITLGAIGICAEFCRPGSIWPGSMGAAGVLLGLSALARYSVDGRGAALIAAAALLLAFQTRVAARTAMAVAAAIFLACGLHMLIRSPDPVLRIHWATAIVIALILAPLFALLLSIAAKARHNKQAAIS